MKMCSAPDCDRPSRVKGLCHKHYSRMWRNGDLYLRKADDGAPMAFLLAHLKYDSEACLIWPFAKDNGYGVLEVEKGVNMKAHRYMCILAHGDPPFEGAQAAHNCGKGKDGCFAPNHVRWATRLENEADKFTHGTTNRGAKHGMAKLTNDKVLAIYADPRSQYEIAEAFEISQAAVSCIKTGVTWAWLTGHKRAA